MKAILTVLGVDQVGIIYNVSKTLYEYNINILDLSQTTMDDKFVAMVNVDLSDAKASFDEIAKAFDELSEKTGLQIRIQNEKLFDTMHRI